MKELFERIQMFTDVTSTTANQPTVVGEGAAAKSIEVDHTYWQTALIYLAQPKLVHSAFAQKVGIPRGNSATVEWRKVPLLTSTVSAAELTEGSAGAAIQATVQRVTATVKQYGHYIRYTDMLEMTAKDGMMNVYSRTLSEQAATIAEKIDRDAVLAGLLTELYPGSYTRANVGTDGSKYLTVDDLFRAASILEANNAPTIDGDYIAVVHPFVLKDLMTTVESGKVNWIDVKQYVDQKDMLEGEVGKIGRVRVISTPIAKVHAAGNGSTGGTWEVSPAAGETPAVYNSKDVFVTEVFGANCFGTTEISGGGLELIAHDKSEAGGALNQYGTVGWKMTRATAVLVPEYGLKIASNASRTVSADN